MAKEQIESVLGYVEKTNPKIKKIKTVKDKESGHTFIDVTEKSGRETRTVIHKDDLEDGDEQAVSVAFVTWVEEVLDAEPPTV